MSRNVSEQNLWRTQLIDELALSAIEVVLYNCMDISCCTRCQCSI